MHFLLTYETAPDYLTRRAEFRDAHLEKARAAVTRGELVLGGAVGDPVDSAALLFEGPTDAAARAFAEADPYVVHGLVTSFRVRPWNTVVGAAAATRLRGESTPTDVASVSRGELVAFLRGARHGVVSSIAADGSPQSATVGLTVSETLELVFDTLVETRKASNLRRDPRASIVLTRGDATAQIEGLADEPRGAELAEAKKVYFDSFPDGPTRSAWPGITYFRVRPTWVRLTDFGFDPPRIVALGPDDLTKLLRDA